ncbi:MAG: hypothetical protein KKH94_01240 [Candidatus Omnitrophica bacterium]|nr:hypothetical protein [Candidatus Omnitrophota bacterium]
MNKKITVSLFTAVSLILIISFYFCNVEFKHVFFTYPKDSSVDYNKISKLKKEEVLGMEFLLPEEFTIAKSENNTVAYRIDNNRIIFIIEVNRPDLFAKNLRNRYKNDYEFYCKILSNKWDLGYLKLKYHIVSSWKDLEIKRIKMGILKGFIFSGTKKKQKKNRRHYLYELFTEDYRLTIAVRVNKEEHFGEKEINFILSSLKFEK